MTDTQSRFKCEGSQPKESWTCMGCFFSSKGLYFHSTKQKAYNCQKRWPAKGRIRPHY